MRLRLCGLSSKNKKMIIKIAWKNIWRSRIRSLVVITAIALGLWAGVFASAFVNGMMEQKISSVIEMEMSHFQFHEKGFRDEFESKLYMPEGENILQTVSKDSLVKHTTGRIAAMVMLGSANQSGAIKAIGIDPSQEGLVTGLNNKVVEGKYFEGIKRNPILISTKTAEKYKIKVRSKIVLTFQDLEGEMTAGAFRVVGLFDTKNGMYDEMNAFVRKEDLSKLLKLPVGSLHEIAVLLDRHDNAELVANNYQELYPNKEVLPWMDLAIGMRYMVDMMGSYTTILVGIILIALLFSIINTMLMAVLERTRELGMLMAIGMTKGKVFLMIMYETIFLSFIGGPLGLLLSWLVVGYFGSAGIDLSGAGYEEVGMPTIIYPTLLPKDYMQVSIMVVVMSIVAAIYPARKALGLNPVEAIRKI